MSEPCEEYVSVLGRLYSSDVQVCSRFAASFLMETELPRGA